MGKLKFKIIVYASARRPSNLEIIKSITYTIRKKEDLEIALNKLRRFTEKYLPQTERGIFWYARVLSNGVDILDTFGLFHSVDDVYILIENIKDQYYWVLEHNGG